MKSMMDLVHRENSEVDSETLETEAETKTETDSCQRWSWTSRRMHKLSENQEREKS